MSTVGLIAEYNPFHHGHSYHLNKSKELTGAKFLIAVMSGNFLQRGEPALLNKWTRARMALSAGIDIVVELPFVFASQDARGFAQAGIRLLNALGVVDYVSFGCEYNQLEGLTEIAKLLKAEPPYFQRILREEAKKGYSFPMIREKAITEYFHQYRTRLKYITMDKIKEILRQPNNILALEYMMALQKQKSSLKPLPIKRIGSRYSQDKLEGQYSSATAIRKRIIEDFLKNSRTAFKELKRYMPSSTLNILINELQNGINPIMLSCFEQAIFYHLRRIDLKDMKKIHGVQEGLENRIKSSVLLHDSLESMIQAIKTKRYTRTRIQRILIHSLFDLTKKEVITFNKKGPLYCRILGMTERGKSILKKIKIQSNVPVVMKVKTFNERNKRNGNEVIQRMLDYDILATDLYVLGYKPRVLRKGGQDYTNQVVLL